MKGQFRPRPVWELVWLGNRVAKVCGWLAEFFEERQRRWDRCEHCGRSRFYGEGCTPLYIDVARQSPPLSRRGHS